MGAVAGVGVVAAIGHDDAPAAPWPEPPFVWTDQGRDVCRWLGGDLHGVDGCRYQVATVHGHDVMPCPGTLTYEAALAADCFDGSVADNER
jgi:hypothetical protein